MRTALCLVGISCALLAAAPAPAAAIPPELRRAAILSENDHHGIVGFEITWDTDARGGPFRQRFHYRNAYVYDGERFLGARALEKVDNGKAADAHGLDEETKKIEREHSGASVPGFAVPFDSRHFDEYRFRRAPCDAACLEGDTSIGFEALINDQNHGDGRLIIDRDGHVRHLEYVPKVKPVFGGIHAREASVSIDRGAVLPGYWSTTTMLTRFSGRYGFIVGQAIQTTQFDHYRRFRTPDAALSALRTGQI